MKHDTTAALDFRMAEGSLSFRLGRSAALRLLPLVLAPIVDGLLLWGPPRAAFAHNDLFLKLILTWGVIFQLAYAFWVLRDCLLPYVVDERAGTLRRGQRTICVLVDITGAGVTVYHGRSNLYYVSLGMRGQDKPRKLLLLLTSKSAHSGAQELAQHLKVPGITDKEEGLWCK